VSTWYDSTVKIHEYEIVGDANDVSNWRRIETIGISASVYWDEYRK